MRLLTGLLAVLLLTACTGLPGNIKPVADFDLNRYLGTWYEIARLDHSFERGLSNVTAQYSLRDDGGVTVINGGFDKQKGKWKSATGKALFTGSETSGHLKVSFFGPFYGSYVVFTLDPDYQYAFITGFNKKFLWLLSRSPTVKPAVLDLFMQQAKAAGFDLSDLILVDHSTVAPKS